MSLEPRAIDITNPDNIEELTKQGLNIYDAQLKAILEPDQNGHFVAIHVGSGNYYIGKTAAEASRKLHEQHPADGNMVLRKIGPEPEYGLASRLFAGEFTAVRGK